MKLIENENPGIETLYSMNGVVSKITKREDGYYDILVLNIHLESQFLKQYEILRVEELFTDINIGDILFFVYDDDEYKKVHLLAVKTNYSEKYCQHYNPFIEYDCVRNRFIKDKKKFKEHDSVISDKQKIDSMIGWLNIGFLSPNKYIWIIIMPIIIFIAIVEAYTTTEAIDRNRDDK